MSAKHARRRKPKKLKAAAIEAKPAPAVIDDELWDGPRWINDVGPEPVYVRTKSEYWKLLRKHGLRMKGQQESTTGDGPKGEAFVTPKLDPVVVVPPLTQEEAHLFGAMSAIFKKFGLKEVLTCNACLARNRNDGVRPTITNRRVVIECRCGIAEYVAPTGTTDLVLEKLANTAITQNDKVMGVVMTDAGHVNRPTTLLHDMEALLIRRYVGVLHARSLEPHWFHEGGGPGRGCWTRNPLNFTEEVAAKVTRRQVVLACKCQTLFWQGKRTDEIAAATVQ